MQGRDGRGQCTLVGQGVALAKACFTWGTPPFSPPALTALCALPACLPACCVQVWGVAVALYLVGTVVWNLFATGEKVFD